MEAQMAQQESQQKMQNEERKMALKEAQGHSKIQAEREASKQKIQEAAVMGDIKTRNALIGSVMQRNAEGQAHQQKMSQKQQEHALKMRQQAEKKASKPKKG